MSNQPNLEDTQPKSPFNQLPGEGRRPPRMIDPEDSGRRAGCGMMGFVGGLMALFAVVIVLLAGAAGWTTGQREAAAAATSTQRAAIDEQLSRIPSDVSSGNTVLLDARLRFLEALGVQQVGEFAPTATALFISSQPTLTPTPTPTLEATVIAPEVTPEVTEAPIPTVGAGGYDLASIYQQAQNSFGAGAYEDAAEYLDVIIAVDEGYESAAVRRLMSQTLNAWARSLYQAMQPAAANLVIDRARQYGALEDGLEYESYAATLYLNARALVGSDYSAAIQALRELVNLGAGGRYYQEALQMLFNAYVGYGDAWAAQGAYCPAEQQYRNALQVLSSGSVSAKLSTAVNFCQNGTPTPDPLAGQGGVGSGGGLPPIGAPGQ